MRRIRRLLLTTVLLLGGAFALAGPAVAALALDEGPYTVDRSCSGPPEFEVCSSSKGVVVRETSASGNTLFKASGTQEIEVLSNGTIVVEISSRENFVVVDRDGMQQVYHQTTTGHSVVIGGQTCTFKINIILVSGEPRHEVNDAKCTP
jgi:hypothetical protein